MKADAKQRISEILQKEQKYRQLILTFFDECRDFDIRTLVSFLNKSPEYVLDLVEKLVEEGAFQIRCHKFANGPFIRISLTKDFLKLLETLCSKELVHVLRNIEFKKRRKK